MIFYICPVCKEAVAYGSCGCSAIRVRRDLSLNFDPTDGLPEMVDATEQWQLPLEIWAECYPDELGGTHFALCKKALRDGLLVPDYVIQQYPSLTRRSRRRRK